MPIMSFNQRTKLRLVAASVRFRHAAEGIAAVEFALVLPVMLVILLGLAQVTGGITRDRKLVLLTRAVADLASREKELNATTLGTIFSAASAILQPYYDDSSADKKPQMVVSRIDVKQTGSTFKGKVGWSCGRNIPSSGTGNLVVRTKNNDYDKSVPAGYESTASFILVETQWKYTPVIGFVFTGAINLNESWPWPIRNGDTVALDGACPSNT